MFFIFLSCKHASNTNETIRCLCWRQDNWYLNIKPCKSSIQASTSLDQIKVPTNHKVCHQILQYLCFNGSTNIFWRMLTMVSYLLAFKIVISTKPVNTKKPIVYVPLSINMCPNQHPEITTLIECSRNR